MGWGYVAPPDQPTPLVLKVFNPTFWVMVEMCLGAWAANLPPLGPLLGAIGFREWVSSAYRKISEVSHSWQSEKSKTSKREESELTHQDSEISLVEARSQQQRHV